METAGDKVMAAFDHLLDPGSLKDDQGLPYLSWDQPNLRASALLNFKAGQVKCLKLIDDIEIKEKKTGKAKRISFE